MDVAREVMERHGEAINARDVEAMKELPKTATGKLQKEDLRRADVTERTRDRTSVGSKIARR